MRDEHKILIATSLIQDCKNYLCHSQDNPDLVPAHYKMILDELKKLRQAIRDQFPTEPGDIPDNQLRLWLQMRNIDLNWNPIGLNTAWTKILDHLVDFFKLHQDFFIYLNDRHNDFIYFLNPLQTKEVQFEYKRLTKLITLHLKTSDALREYKKHLETENLSTLKIFFSNIPQLVLALNGAKDDINKLYVHYAELKTYPAPDFDTLETLDTIATSNFFPLFFDSRWENSLNNLSNLEPLSRIFVSDCCKLLAEAKKIDLNILSKVKEIYASQSSPRSQKIFLIEYFNFTGPLRQFCSGDTLRKFCLLCNQYDKQQTLLKEGLCKIESKIQALQIDINISRPFVRSSNNGATDSACRDNSPIKRNLTLSRLFQTPARNIENERRSFSYPIKRRMEEPNTMEQQLNSIQILLIAVTNKSLFFNNEIKEKWEECKKKVVDLENKLKTIAAELVTTEAEEKINLSPLRLAK